MFFIRLKEKSNPPSADEQRVLESVYAGYLSRALNRSVTHINDIVWIACCRMEKLGLWSFEVGGLGKDVWSTSIFDELFAVVEYVPKVVTDLERGQSTQLSFFEENVQTVVRLTPKDQLVVYVEPHSRPFWNLKAGEQSFPLLIKELREVFKVFYEAVEEHCPEVNQTQVWKEFIAKPEVQACLR